MPAGHTSFAPADDIVVLSDADGGIYPHRVTLRDRLSARVHADRWDHALARGTSPDSTAPLALHARALVSPTCRRELAASLARILDDAEGGHVPDWNALGPRHRHAHVLAARRDVELLIRHLAAPGPVAGRGVALVRLLLTDGGGPLYRRTAPAHLTTELRRAADALDPTTEPTTTEP
jgi:hypothetical protein